MDSSNGMDVNGKQEELDVGLYSRQLYVLGTEGMRRMATADILISGLGGPGLEIAKNIILAGVRSVTIHDPNPITWSDLSTQFFAGSDDVGHGRAEVCKDKLAELNAHVSVHLLDKLKLDSEDIKKFTVVVLSQALHDVCTEIGELCHSSGVKVVVASTCGVFGKLFTDFGEDFTVFDPSGETPPSVFVQQIERSKDGLVTCLEETRHSFQDGDYVTFSEVKGMTELNGCEPRKVTIVGPDAFSIGDTSTLNKYLSGGTCTKVTLPEKHSYKSYSDGFLSPDFMVSDFTKIERSPQLHLFFMALSAYSKQHKGSFPGSWSQTDALGFLDFVKSANSELKGSAAFVDEVDEHLCSLFSYTCFGQCCPIQAVIGGFAAQEVMKACTNKFVPLNQWCYYDATECLSMTELKNDGSNLKNVVIAEGDASPQGNRYDGQIAIFGKQIHQKLLNSKLFLVGSGAIGCELLKNFALMGVGAGPEGAVFLTDNDSIERSNLNRQFLFRSGDIGKMKALVAASVAKKMNPEMNIVAHENRVGPETESIYDDSFFEPLDCIVNALDNIEARSYMDRRCVYYHKPLLESGTLGTKGNIQVVIPFRTESYSSSQDPPERSFPSCTLKNFPYLIEHTLQWARDHFEGYFVNQTQNICSFLREPAKFLDRTMREAGNQPLETLETLRANLIEKRPSSFADCVAHGRLLWQDLFSSTIMQLLFNFPPDHKTMSGADFWSGTKRCPHPLEFNVNDASHLDFVMATANLRAFIYGIPQCRDANKIITLIRAVQVPPFTPKAGVRIEVTESEVQNRPSAMLDNNRLAELQKMLSNFKPSKDDNFNVIEFEKDDDTNFHMDFITAASNCRAECYDIPPADKLKSKLIAGKIIPAIATTTALVAGLACLELYKILRGFTAVEQYKNAYVNLSEPFFAFYEPVPPAKSKYGDVEFSLWDRFELHSPMTLQQFIDHFKNEFKLEVTMLSQDVSLIYTFILSKEKREERLAMPLEKLVETISKRSIPPHVNALVFDLCCCDEDGGDVDVPYVRYQLNRNK